MATIIKNSAGNWKALIRKKGWPTTSKTFNTKRDAQDWSRRVEDEMVRGVYINRAPSENLTVHSAINRYLVEITPTKSVGAVVREKSLSKPLIEELGDYSLAAITADLLSNYRDKRAASRNKHGNLRSANQIRLELAFLSHLFTVAIQEWGIGLSFNPVKSIRKPKLPAGRDRRLSLDEETKLFVECQKLSNPMLCWIVRLALETGMRRNEMATLRRGQVDLKKRVIHLRSADTKTNEARLVPLSRDAVEVLDQAMHQHIRIIDSDLIFWGESRDTAGKRQPYDFATTWNTVRKRAMLQDFKFHDLRHEAISQMVEGGLSDQEVVAISGHKTMQMLKHYTHLRSEHLAARLDEINRKFLSR